jgi:phosphoribosylformylglycinamidine synthase
MAMAGGVGAELLSAPDGAAPHAYWFGEDQGRYVLALAESGALLRAAQAGGVSARRIGTTGGTSLTLPGVPPISIDTLLEAHERFFPEWMRS